MHRRLLKRFNFNLPNNVPDHLRQEARGPLPRRPLPPIPSAPSLRRSPESSHYIGSTLKDANCDTYESMDESNQMIPAVENASSEYQDLESILPKQYPFL